MPRRAAWNLLRSGSPTPLREVDAFAAARDLEPRDRALMRRLVGTEVRRRGSLRALVSRFGPRRVKPDLAAHLHLALVQVFFLDRIPERAILSETLRHVRETLAPHHLRDARACIEAALAARRTGASGDPRRDIPLRELHLAEAVFADPGEHPFLWAEQALSLPAPLFKRWVKRHGDERARALALLALTEPPLSLRVAHGTRAQALEELAREDVAGARPGAHPDMILAPGEAVAAVTHGAAFGAGRLTVQGESALRAAEALGARAGEELLELCAAPGGKTAVLAGAGAGVVACDVHPGRLFGVRSTLERLGLAARLVASDGDRALAPGREFAGVLVDAPCTNTGVLAQRPGARWRFGPRARAELAALQARLLSEGARRVRPGGRLVWSTCSLEPDENGQRVRAFLAGRSDWSLEEELETLPSGAAGGPVDGGYFARLGRRV